MQRIMLTFLIVSTLFAGCANIIPTNSSAESVWRIVPKSEPDSVVAQTRSRGSLVSVLCLPDGCRALVVAPSPCQPNSIVPVLINTEVDSIIATGSCLPIERESLKRDNPASSETGAVYLTDPNLLLPQIVFGDDITIAIPASNGKIDVYSIPTVGLRSLMESVKPDIFDFPELRDNTELSPYGVPTPPNLDEKEENSWQRGMDSV